MLTRNSSLLIHGLLLSNLLLLNSCEDPYQPHRPMSPLMHDADSVWLRAHYDRHPWSPGDSTDHTFWMSFDPSTSNFSLWAWNTDRTTNKGPGIMIEIDSVAGAGVYAATLNGPSRITFTSTGDGRADRAGKAFDGTVTLDVFDTMASPRIHGTFDLRIQQTFPEPDTFTITGEFEGRWR